MFPGLRTVPGHEATGKINSPKPRAPVRIKSLIKASFFLSSLLSGVCWALERRTSLFSLVRIDKLPRERLRFSQGYSCLARATSISPLPHCFFFLLLSFPRFFLARRVALSATGELSSARQIYRSLHSRDFIATVKRARELGLPTPAVFLSITSRPTRDVFGCSWFIQLANVERRFSHHLFRHNSIITN